MLFLRELINSGKVGGYIGKGNKCLKKKEYEKAVNYYFSALKYNKKNIGIEAILRQNIAYAYELLDNKEEALKNARMSLELYERLGESANIGIYKNQVIELIARLEVVS